MNKNMRKNNKKTFFIIFIISLIIFSLNASLSCAVLLSVNKAVINYDDVLRGGYAEDSVLVMTDYPDNLSINYDMHGDIAGWIRVEPNESLYMSINRNQLIKVIIEPPEDMPSGNYSGSIRVMAGSIPKPEGAQYGASVLSAFIIKINVGITGDEIIKCNSGAFDIEDAEEGSSLKFSSSVKNEGNVRVKPRFIVDIWNQDQSQLLFTREFVSDEYILPTASMKISYEIEDPGLSKGQYWADFSVSPCRGTGKTTFDVMEKGAITDEGELIRLETKSWASVDEVVPVKAIFRNTGKRTVSAKFTGRIYAGDKVIGIIESDTLEVEPSETKTFEAYFRPQEISQYYISGRVLYNNKLTYEKSTVLNVDKEKPEGAFPWLALIAITIAILFLLIMIKKKKSQKHNIFR
ncbi:hypothetical protein JXB41_04575 [Candidatus Woesearchaeota archaeon]|nr:hypothetical protein [Candidatus Woesearchaeota archaeon]